VDTDSDGEQSFTHRRHWVAQQLRALGAEIYGFQETTIPMRAFLEDALPEYSFLGCGRNDEDDGEHTPIAVRKDAFALLGLHNAWLSLTPNVPGSRYGVDQSCWPRMYTMARLLHQASGRCLLMYNTHLDCAGEIARLLGAAQLRQAIALDAAMHHPAPTLLLTGDFNAPPESSCIALLLADGTLRDATAGLGGTFHNYGREAEPGKIDYVFTNAPFANSRVLGGKSPEGLWFSDHEMVVSAVELLHGGIV
jgi:endonuclease/exonuclease/phosphatase family metal-dependent hydrolase